MPVFLTPDMSVRSDQEAEQALSPFQRIQKQTSLRMFLLGTGTVAAIGARAASLGSLLHFYHKLSQELNEDMEKAADSLLSLQGQINLLAAVVLQNCRKRRKLCILRGRVLLLREPIRNSSHKN